MRNVTLADAKTHLSELIAEVENGGTVQITKRGKVAARLVPVEPTKRPLDVEAIWAVTKTMPMQTESAGEFIRRMRDEDKL